MALERTLILEREDPKSKDNAMLDPGAFDGKNPIRIIQDPTTMMFSFSYKHGVVPASLRTRFTSFNLAKAHAEQYFKTKKIKIVDIQY